MHLCVRLSRAAAVHLKPCSQATTGVPTNASSSIYSAVLRRGELFCVRTYVQRSFDVIVTFRMITCTLCLFCRHNNNIVVRKGGRGGAECQGITWFP